MKELNVKTTVVSTEDVGLLETVSFEVEARKSIITQMLQSGMSIESDSFKKYNKEYTEFFVQFEELKRELEKKYVPDEFKAHGVSWKLDYSTGEMTITKTCDC